MANTLQGGTTLVFSVGSQTYGLVQSWNVDEVTDEATAMGPGGHVNSVQQHNDRKVLTLNYLELGTPVSPPEIGSVFSFDDGDGAVDYYLTSMNSGRTVDGFKTVDITGTNWPNLP